MSARVHWNRSFPLSEKAAAWAARFFCKLCAGFAVLIMLASVGRADEIHLPPEAKHALELIYSGDAAAALPIAHALEEKQPDDPLGFLIEAEAGWWNIYCEACEVKWGMVDDWAHGRRLSHDAYLKLADQVVQLAQAQLAKSETAEMHLYAGLGWALKARAYNQRDERRNIAHAGVSARTEFMRALQLDPDMADAAAGLGLYNYYVDTLSPGVKILRFFMGIPGGNKQDGIRQMQQGAEHGELFAVDARFYLAKNLRTYDTRYEQALAVAQPLVETYPHNPIFLMLVGNLNAELGRKEKAGEYFRAARAASAPGEACAQQIREITDAFLGAPN